MKSLKRKSLPSQLADTIQKEIESGEFKNILPGYRNLMQIYLVSNKTVSAALDILETKGVLTPSEKGKPRRISKNYVNHVKKTDTMLFLVEKRQHSPQIERFVFAATIEAWQSIKEKAHRIDINLQTSPNDQLKALIQRYQPTVIVGHVLNKAWSDAVIETNIPFFAMGGVVDQEAVVGTGYKYSDACENVIQHLANLGHRRILIPHRLGTEWVQEQAKHSLERILGDKLSQLEREAFCPVIQENQPEVWQSFLHQKITQLKPTAIISEDLIQLISIYSYCNNYGLSIPNDISLVCLGDSETIEWFHPTITRMSYPFDKQLKLFLNWVQSEYTISKFHYVQMKWVEGKTVKNLVTK